MMRSKDYPQGINQGIGVRRMEGYIILLRTSQLVPARTELSREPALVTSKGLLRQEN